MFAHTFITCLNHIEKEAMMTLTFEQFTAALAEDLNEPEKEPRVDLNQMPDSYYEEMGTEIDAHPIGVPHTRRPSKGPLD